MSCHKSLTCLLRYPTLISESLGDRLGGEHLHLYWRDFHEGLGAGKSMFRFLAFRLSRSFISVPFRKATLSIELKDNSSTSSPSTSVSTSLSVSTYASISTSPITTTTTTPGEMIPWHKIDCDAKRKSNIKVSKSREKVVFLKLFSNSLCTSYFLVHVLKIKQGKSWSCEQILASPFPRALQPGRHHGIIKWEHFIAFCRVLSKRTVGFNSPNGYSFA